MKSVIIFILSVCCVVALGSYCAPDKTSNEIEPPKFDFSQNYSDFVFQQSSSESQMKIDENFEFVYITKTGKCYHKGYCSHAKKRERTLLKNSAIQLGYRACYYCCY